MLLLFMLVTVVELELADVDIKLLVEIDRLLVVELDNEELVDVVILHGTLRI